MMKAMIEQGLPPDAAPSDINQIRFDAFPRCAEQVGWPSDATKGWPMLETQVTAHAESPRPKAADWSDQSKAAFIDGCAHGILVPANNDYVIRTQVLDSLMSVEVALSALADSYLRTRTLPANLHARGLPETSADRRL
jgi:hypothetical protein